MHIFCGFNYRPSWPGLIGRIKRTGSHISYLQPQVAGLKLSQDSHFHFLKVKVLIVFLFCFILCQHCCLLPSYDKARTLEPCNTEYIVNPVLLVSGLLAPCKVKKSARHIPAHSSWPQERGSPAAG